MSASSLCVTCGTLSQDRCRNGPDTFLIRDSATVSTGAELGEVLGRDLRDPRPAAPRRPGRPPAARVPCRKASRSSLVIRPFGPDGVTEARSTPSSRAVRRTDGPACTPSGVPMPAAAGVSAPRAAAACAGAVAGPPVGSAAGVGVGARGGGFLLLDQRRRAGDRTVAGGEQQDGRALADLVAHLDQDLGHRAGGRGGDVHRGLVGLEGDQRVLGVDLVARGHVHLDDRDTAEVADVGNLDLGRSCHVDRLFLDRRRMVRRGRGRSCRCRCRSA